MQGLRGGDSTFVCERCGFRPPHNLESVCARGCASPVEHLFKEDDFGLCLDSVLTSKSLFVGSLQSFEASSSQSELLQNKKLSVVFLDVSVFTKSFSGVCSEVRLDSGISTF